MQAGMTEHECFLLYTYSAAIWTKKVLERDRKRIEKAGLKFPRIYDDWIGSLERKNGEVLQELRHDMQQHGMKIWKLETENSAVEAAYGCQCRGYTYTCRIQLPVLRRNVERHMRRLVLDQELALEQWEG
ncbi:hypothetical protein [Alkalicoccus chagannorensis]|uniref:hypothetical protein n=1 Tax=Alkalicoccus chagannorensis TaxID=427072 RepID=UPI0004224B03|nr:hypothetical protein [Alkalicoccus chagannorensis]